MLSYQYAIDLLQRDDFERARKFEPTIAKDEETDNPFYYIRALQILRQPIPRIIYNSLSDLQKSRLGRDVKIREDNIAERRINKIYKLFLRS
jgi:hypothetical protein